MNRYYLLHIVQPYPLVLEDTQDICLHSTYGMLSCPLSMKGE